jgi:hypothetical protein
LGTLDNKVVVSAGRIEQLENIFIKTWQRPPTANELKGLVDDFILEEIYYRQAVAMGIDRDDTVIRRRLRQKFEFLTDDMAAASTPSDEELQFISPPMLATSSEMVHIRSGRSISIPVNPMLNGRHQNNSQLCGRETQYTVVPVFFLPVSRMLQLASSMAHLASALPKALTRFQWENGWARSNPDSACT